MVRLLLLSVTVSWMKVLRCLRLNRAVLLMRCLVRLSCGVVEFLVWLDYCYEVVVCCGPAALGRVWLLCYGVVYLVVTALIGCTLLNGTNPMLVGSVAGLKCLSVRQVLVIVMTDCSWVLLGVRFLLVTMNEVFCSDVPLVSVRRCLLREVGMILLVRLRMRKNGIGRCGTWLMPC